MEVIPSIDVRAGRCVRLYQGDYDRETVYDEDPVAVADRWQAAGATTLLFDGSRWGNSYWVNGHWDNGHWDNGHWDADYWDNGHWDAAYWDNGHWDNGHWDNGHWDSSTYD